MRQHARVMRSNAHVSRCDTRSNLSLTHVKARHHGGKKQKEHLYHQLHLVARLELGGAGPIPPQASLRITRSGQHRSGLQPRA